MTLLYIPSKARLGNHVPDKNICLTFEISDLSRMAGNLFSKTATEIANWIQYHTSWVSSPLHADVCAAHPFVQSKSDSYLMLEFWTKDVGAIRKFVTLLRGKFEFKVDEDTLGGQIGVPSTKGTDPLSAIKQAISDYHYALDTRQHGGVAQDKAFNTICAVLGMHWVQGGRTCRLQGSGADMSVKAHLKRPADDSGEAT